MKRILMLAVALAFVLIVASPAPAQDVASQIVGVWKLQKFDRCVVGGSCAAFYGDKPTGHVIYTKGGLFVSQGYGTTRVVPKTPDPTDAERIELFKSMYSWGGTYKVEGNKVTTVVEFAWNEGWKGMTRVAASKIEGKTLSLESSPFKSVIDGAMIFTRTAFERVE